MSKGEDAKSSTRTRLDKLLVDRGLMQSRERAQALILAGRVLVGEQRVDKPGTAVADSAVLRLLGEDLKFVGRGGLKLEKALEHWGIELGEVACLDVGASTGGFTDCMLQRGARSVLAIDTGYGQIAEKLRRDARVTLMERTNARLLERGSLGAAGIGFLAMDVSFISATLVLPSVLGALGTQDGAWAGEAVVLIKPQFEAGRKYVGKGGIVREAEGRELAITRVREAAAALGGEALEVIDSPIRGREGNYEYLLRGKFGGATAAE